MKYKYILLDADNTIWDYTRAESESISSVFENCGAAEYIPDILKKYPEINDRLWKEHELGKVTLDFLYIERFRQVAAVCEIKELSENDFKQVAKNYIDTLCTKAYLIEGAEDFLKKLSQNFSLVLITNGTIAVQRSRLSITDIKKYFKEIIISEETGFRKPQAQFFDYTIEKIGNPAKEELLIVGDSLSSDITGGVNSCIDTCWYNPHKLINNSEIKPTYEVSSYMQLLELLQII